jgi:uncharacterized integral membrane protein
VAVTLLFVFADVIVLYFLSLMVSLHCVLIAVTMLVFNVRNQGMPAASRKLRWFFIPLHIVFVSALICGATRELGAFCSPA